MVHILISLIYKSVLRCFARPPYTKKKPHSLWDQLYSFFCSFIQHIYKMHSQSRAHIPQFVIARNLILKCAVGAAARRSTAVSHQGISHLFYGILFEIFSVYCALYSLMQVQNKKLFGKNVAAAAPRRFKISATNLNVRSLVLVQSKMDFYCCLIYGN